MKGVSDDYPRRLDRLGESDEDMFENVLPSRSSDWETPLEEGPTLFEEHLLVVGATMTSATLGRYGSG